MRRKSRSMNLKTPLRIYLLAGACSVALAAAALSVVSVRTVHADARIRPAQPSPAVSAQSAAQVSLTADAVSRKGQLLHGIASWYGGIFDGRKTASGERFDMYAMTACHPTLPFGTLVRVINLKNHRSVVVRITDRGDLVEQGRIIDLSYGAAQKLAMVHSGLAPVDLQVLKVGAQ
jgi:peptidoglycan lytic transglycosylase